MNGNCYYRHSSFRENVDWLGPKHPQRVRGISSIYAGDVGTWVYPLQPSYGFSSSHVWMWELDHKESCESRSVMSDSLQPPWNSSGQNTGVGSLSLLQGIFPTQGSNPGLPHCRKMLYQLSHKGSPRILEWASVFWRSSASGDPFSRGSSQHRNQTGFHSQSCIAGGFFTNWAIKESWVLKSWCFWTVVFKKTLESPLDSKEIKPVNPKGNQPWIFIGRTDADAEAPILWPLDEKNWLIGKDTDAVKDWRQEEKGTTEDEKGTTEVEMVGWHHQLDAYEFETAPGAGDGQGSLMCCSPWGCKVLDMTEQLNWIELSSQHWVRLCG